MVDIDGDVGAAHIADGPMLLELLNRRVWRQRRLDVLVAKRFVFTGLAIGYQDRFIAATAQAMARAARRDALWLG